jgi:membrane-bound lytic murein transglycosylase D
VILLAPVLFLTGCPSDQQTQSTPPPQAIAPQASAPAPAPRPQPPQPTPSQQRVRSLIAQVEAAYARGEASYHKGQLADAKIQLDRSVDLLLASGYDIAAEPQLQEEFEHLVDRINGLEMEALKQGNGFVPPQEISPSEAANDVTFTVDPNAIAKAQAQLATTKSDLPLVVNEYVASFINFFAYTQKGHNTLLHSLQRSGRYRAMIQRVMAEEGMPQDLIYLAVAESGFNPRALNARSHAGGMWQFMPSPVYGLTRTAYVDERFDPEKSTRAYARYMKFIYDQLGDWYLAMAAYDHGAGNIQREVEKTGYADFWELYKRHELPAETQNYVPEILAAIIIANNPHQYGFDDIDLDPPILTDTVTVSESVDLRLVSDLTGAPVDEIEALNPSLLRMVTPPDAPFDLHLPAGTAALYTQRIALIPAGHRNSWRYHPMAPGDTLDSVARFFHVTTAELASANQLTAGQDLAGVEALIVPVPLTETATTRARVYTVRRGDTLVTIADRFGVSLTQLRRWNGIKAGIKVAVGSKLNIAEPVARRTATGRKLASPAAGKASSSKKSTSAASSAAGSKSTPATSAKKTPPASSSSTKAKAKPSSTTKSSSSN